MNEEIWVEDRRMLDIAQHNHRVEAKLGSAMEDNPETGRFRVARDIFTDPELFELEIKHIWEGNWIFLAHETQIPNKNDYLTLYMGRQPIVIARNRNGELNAFINAHAAIAEQCSVDTRRLTNPPTPARSMAGLSIILASF
jgi:hypothetical protein